MAENDALADQQRHAEGRTGIVFLDIDGVLNSPDWFGHWPPKDEVTAGIDVRDLALVADMYLDPVAVQRLNRLAGKAEIVITSSWRRGFTAAEIRWMLVMIRRTCRSAAALCRNRRDEWEQEQKSE